MDHAHHEHHEHDHANMAVQQIELLTPTTVSTTHPGNHYEHEMLSEHAAHGPMQHMMSMSFHFGCNETILFDWWRIETVAGLLVSMLIIFLLALLYEGLKHYREHLLWKTYNLLEYHPVTTPTQTTNSDVLPTTTMPQTTTRRRMQPSILSLTHLYQTLLHVVQVTLSFMLMLIFMTYNVWLCATVVIGASFGYFLFCWKKAVIIEVTDQCH